MKELLLILLKSHYKAATARRILSLFFTYIQPSHSFFYLFHFFYSFFSKFSLISNKKLSIFLSSVNFVISFYLIYAIYLMMKEQSATAMISSNPCYDFYNPSIFCITSYFKSPRISNI